MLPPPTLGLVFLCGRRNAACRNLLRHKHFGSFAAGMFAAYRRPIKRPVWD
jgi:hypothetical protein